MERLKELGVRRWWRFVDDIFATVESKEQAERVLLFIDKLHPNIHFTIEHEQKNRLPFLDTSVIRRKTGYITTLYRKKTFTGVHLNWSSLTARRYKIGLIRNSVNRIWRIVKDEKERQAEIERLKVILARNDYPPDVVDTTISLFIEQKARQANPSKPEKETTRFLKLPYVGRKCEDFAFRLKQLVNEHFPQVEFNVAFQAPMTIGKMFPFKDKIKNVMEQSLVVYSFTCKCGAEYIGKTDRILHYRVKEHARPGSKSALRQHLDKSKAKKWREQHKVDFEAVEIIDSADNDRKLRIKELLHILSRNPEINKQLGSQSEYEIKTLIIQAYPQFRSNK